jgi:hypothetical protein
MIKEERNNDFVIFKREHTRQERQFPSLKIVLPMHHVLMYELNQKVILRRFSEVQMREFQKQLQFQNDFLYEMAQLVAAILNKSLSYRKKSHFDILPGRSSHIWVLF